MAIWNPEHVLLTNKGNEILSKVQTGIGALTITRIVTGGSAVLYDNLAGLEAIPDEKQELSVVSTVTDKLGSTVELMLSNTELEEEYQLYTIGVYVTHPNFVGEQLYLVAECDVTKPDTIPVPSATVATMMYNLYIIHTNTDNVIIQVAPNGYILREQIGAPNGVAGLDENRKVPIANIPKYDYTLTVPASGWLKNNRKGYVQTVTLDGITVNDDPLISPVFTGIYDTDVIILNSWDRVSRISTGANSLTLYAFSDRPSVNLPLHIVSMR